MPKNELGRPRAALTLLIEVVDQRRIELLTSALRTLTGDGCTYNITSSTLGLRHYLYNDQTTTPLWMLINLTEAVAAVPILSPLVGVTLTVHVSPS
jgi:hypothetical protein